MSRIRNNEMTRPVKLHGKAREVIQGSPKPVRRDIGELLLKLQLGISLGMPASRPIIHPGAHELRLKDAAGIYRVFYYLKSSEGILIFHAFVKKTQTTPQSEIETGKKRLQEML